MVKIERQEQDRLVSWKFLEKMEKIYSAFLTPGNFWKFPFFSRVGNFWKVSFCHLEKISKKGPAAHLGMLEIFYWKTFPNFPTAANWKNLEGAVLTLSKIWKSWELLPIGKICKWSIGRQFLLFR